MSTADSESTTLDDRPVFLSAGIPGRDYPGKSDRDEIVSAVCAVVSAVFRARGRLLFGGQPDIVSLVTEAAEGLNRPVGPPPVTLYQSALYAGDLPEQARRLSAVGLARVVTIEAAPGDAPGGGRDGESLVMLRDAMLSPENNPVAGIFVGGGDGVRCEFEQFRKSFPQRPVYIFGAPGGAAQQLAEQEIQASPDPSFIRRLAESNRYSVLAAEVTRDIVTRGSAGHSD